MAKKNAQTTTEPKPAPSKAPAAPGGGGDAIQTKLQGGDLINSETGEMIAKPGDIQTVNPQTAAIMKFSQRLKEGAIVEGNDDATGGMGRATIFQGTTTEQVNYQDCDFKLGNWIDTLEKRKISDRKVQIAVVWAFISYVCWPSGAKVPLYVHKSRADVPKQDLEWNDGKPPAATKCFNALVIIQGEQWPYLMVWKRTAYKSGQAIFQLEERRRLAGKPRGLYELSSEASKNAANQSYQLMTYRPIGDVPEAMMPLLNTCIEDVITMKAATEDMAMNAAIEDGAAGEDDDSAV